MASLRYGFEKLGLERIISVTLPQILASRRVMKTGLNYKGETCWRALDVAWYAIDYPDWKASQKS